MSDTMQISSRMETGVRDTSCFVFAVALHSLLFLWQGGILNLGPGPVDELGDMLVRVDFISDVPSYEPRGGGSPAPKQSFMSKVKSIIKGENPATSREQLAMGQKQTQITPPEPGFMKPDALTEKVFQQPRGFEGAATKKDAVEIALGQNKQVIVQPSQGNFKEATPNLKQNAFKVAPKDMPFKIADARDKDSLSNVNAIPMAIGNATSANIKSLDGGPGAGPVMQSKTFAPSGTTKPASFGSGSASGGNQSSGTGLLAMGAGSSQATAAGSLGTGGGGAASGPGGTGRGGDGTGGGVGNGPGTGAGRGGRSWGGGGPGSSGSSSMNTLERNTVSPLASSGPAGLGKASKDAGYSISGALANRPVTQKVSPPYEMDCRLAIRFRVDWSGKVLDGALIEISSGSPTFDQKVISYLKQWSFSRLGSNRANEIQEGVITFIFKGV